MVGVGRLDLLTTSRALGVGKIMAYLAEYDVVAVIKLLKPDRPFDGTESVSRPPRVGDVGTICHEYIPGDPRAPVVVEMVNGDGLTVWVADFDRSELALVQEHKSIRPC